MLVIGKAQGNVVQTKGGVRAKVGLPARDQLFPVVPHNANPS